MAHNVDAEMRAYEIRMRAARKAGELSKKIEKASANRGNQYKEASPHSAEQAKGAVLEKAGVSTQQASEWERLSEVPTDEFEAALATKSVRDLIDKPTPVSDDAPLFIGSMRDFERRGYLARTPADFMATMTEDMLEEVYRIAPLAAAWLSAEMEAGQGHRRPGRRMLDRRRRQARSGTRKGPKGEGDEGST